MTFLFFISFDIFRVIFREKQKTQGRAIACSLTQEQVESLYNKMVNFSFETNSTGAETKCVEFKTGLQGVGTVTPKGYIQIGLSKVKSKFFAHQIAYAAKHGVDKLPTDRIMHISHLCHNKRCINPNHLTLEKDSVNRSRNYCLYKVWCENCEEQMLVCNHVPPCLTFPPDDNPFVE